MAVNKIVMNTPEGEQALIDLTNDSVTPETLAEGATAHDASGEPIIGTMKSGGGNNGTDDVFAQFIEGNLTDLNSNATSVSDGRFRADIVLETANLPYAGWISSHAFAGCDNLKTVKIPCVEIIAESAFYGCSLLYLVDCSALTLVRSGAFANTDLKAIVIRNTSNVASLADTNVFEDTPISNGNGYIYVPSIVIDAYAAADNWSDYADQFRALEDYTVDGTINGELDVDFGGGVQEFAIAQWDFEAGSPSDVLAGMTANPETPWGEWIYSDNNGGMWAHDDAGYVTSGDLAYYVFNPLTNSLATLEVQIGYLLNEIGEPYIIVITAEEAQAFM